MRKILSLFAAALFFVGCQENMLEETYSSKYSAPLIISVDNTTRSFDEALKWSWEESDHIVGYQNAGDKVRNILTLDKNNDFVCNDFGYSTQEAADFHFFYGVENDDQTLTAYQDGTWRPVYVGTAQATTLDDIKRVELSHLSSALEVRVWKGNKYNHTERKVTEAILLSDNDFVGKWSVADDLTYTQSFDGKEIALSNLDTSTIVFNMPVNEEGFAKNEFTLTLTYEGKDYTDSLPALTFEAGKRTIMNITIAATAALLPKGSTVKDKIPTNATSVKFVTNSDFAEGNNIAVTTSDYPIYVVVKNETEVEFHTPAEKYMANADCEEMFYQKNQLTSIDLTNIDTSNVTNMYRMFSYCESLTELDLSHFNTSNVTNMSSMFFYCVRLTELDLSHFNTSNVTDVSHIFAYCSGLKTLDLSNFDTSKVTTMAHMFHNCYGLTSLNVSNFNTSKVTTMESMFYNCAGLTSLDLSDFDTSEVTTMSSMFENCSGLKSLDVSNFNTSKVTKMLSMFSRCTGLTSLDLSNFNTSKVATMSYMFHNCTGLTSLNVSNFNTSNVGTMKYMFCNCTGLTSLDLRSFNFTKTSGALATTKENMFSNVGNNYSPNPITITITNGRNFTDFGLGSGNYKIVYVN